MHLDWPVECVECLVYGHELHAVLVGLGCAA